MSPDPFGLAGQLVDSQFQVEKVIGTGGFSVVYRAQHLGLGVPIALKCLRLPRAIDPTLVDTFTKRFRDEGRLAYRLSQGNLDIVRCIAAGATFAPTYKILVPFMALEWLDGISLSVELKERRTQGMKGRSLDEVIAVLDPAAKALAYAHSQGVVHRDIKPANFFIAKTQYGPRMKVVDFGIAKILDPDMVGIAPAAQTVGHYAMCSPPYGAPEQFDPMAGPIGTWTDVYGMAMVILEMLRDKRVRKGENLSACCIEALDKTNIPTPHRLGIAVSARVELALARAVAYESGARHADAGVFWETLKDAAKRRPGPTPSAAPAVSAHRADDTVMDPAARFETTARMVTQAQPEPFPPASVPTRGGSIPGPPMAGTLAGGTAAPSYGPPPAIAPKGTVMLPNRPAIFEPPRPQPVPMDSQYTTDPNPRPAFDAEATDPDDSSHASNEVAHAPPAPPSAPTAPRPTMSPEAKKKLSTRRYGFGPESGPLPSSPDIDPVDPKRRAMQIAFVVVAVCLVITVIGLVVSRMR
jgi:serine/threonine protein kinase